MSFNFSKKTDKEKSLVILWKHFTSPHIAKELCEVFPVWIADDPDGPPPQEVWDYLFDDDGKICRIRTCEERALLRGKMTVSANG